MPAVFRTRTERRQASRLLARRFFALMAIVTACFAAALAGRYGLGWW